MRHVKDIMSTAIVTVAPDESLNRAMKYMLIKGIHHLLVTENQRLVGLLSVRDLDDIGNEEARQGLAVRAAMITDMVTVGPDMPVAEAAELMRKQTIGCLPVVEEDRPIGIVTISDMLAFLARTAGQSQWVPQGP